jgi:hypothetical protein
MASVWHQVWHNPIYQAANQIALATISPYAAAAYNAAYAKSQGGSWNDAIRAAAITYATAQAFDAVGTATGGHNPGADYFGSAKYYANVAGHAAVGCASAAAGGGDCGSGAMSAGFGAAAAPFAIGLGLEGGTAASAIIGGTASVLGGGQFANGAVTAAFGYLYNAQGGFNFDKFAKEIEDNRSNMAADLGALVSAEAVGTMPKTPTELRGLGVPKDQLNPTTGQLSRWTSRTGDRVFRNFGRTSTGVVLGAVATSALVFDGFYNWGVIGSAAWKATSF